MTFFKVRCLIISSAFSGGGGHKTLTRIAHGFLNRPGNQRCERIAEPALRVRDADPVSCRKFLNGKKKPAGKARRVKVHEDKHASPAILAGCNCGRPGHT